MTLAVGIAIALVLAVLLSVFRVAGIHAERERIEDDKRAWEARRDEIGA